MTKVLPSTVVLSLISLTDALTLIALASVGLVQWMYGFTVRC